MSLVEDLLKTSSRSQSFIIDAEVVAIDPATGALKTFQELSNRARKDVKLDDVKVSVCVFAFDLMYLDGQVSRTHPVRGFPTAVGQLLTSDKFRFFWRAPSGSAAPCSGPAFLRTRRRSRAQPGSITFEASRAKQAGRPWGNSGRRP